MTFGDIVERLSALPRNQRLGIFAGVYVLIAVLFFFLLFSPKSEEIATLETKQTELTAEKAKVKARAENREQFERELAQLTNDLKQALRELPEQREIPELLRRISAIGKKAGLEVRRFQPLPEVVRDYYAEVPVSIEVYGSYHEIAMFFDRLSKLGRIVYVRDVEMSKPEERGGKVYLTVTGKSVTFRFLSDDELARRAAAANEGKGKKRKRK